MANLEEVRMESREGEESACPTGEEPGSPRKNRRRSRKRRNSSGSDGASVQGLRSGRDPDSEEKSENGSGEQDTPVDSHEQYSPPTHEDYRTKFYEVYRREAEEYDREFIKRYDEDLNTTLIFAGLFSAVTSAFIIQVQPQLQSDPNEETAALLRVLIHKIDNMTFGGDVPTIPQWFGPPHTIVQVQAILYASLAASLFSAFLAMLGKQWLNRYASIDMRGSVIERSQNRQRKLDGIVTWYFDHVMELLPLMLQFALLLLGCALTRYLWEIDTTVASVVLGVTSFGVASYAFFVVAGTASVSCPYQTPGAHILRHIPPLALSTFRSASSQSKVIYGVAVWWRWVINDLECSIGGFVALILAPIDLLIVLVADAYLLARAMVGAFVANTLRARRWFHRAHGWGPQTTALDLQCISWMLQTSLDKAIHLLTLRLLAMTTTPAGSHPALVSVCIDILASCVSIAGGKVVILQGSEELATLSALCCLSTLSYLVTADPASSAFEDVRRRYTKTFPIETNFNGLPSYHCFCTIHNVFHPSRKRVQLENLYYHPSIRRPRVQWKDYRLSSAEHVALVQLARFKFQRKRQKVPCWILRYVHHLLSQDPLPSASVVADCLSIVAMDLGCTVSNTTTLDENARVEVVSNLITEELENMARVEDLNRIKSKRKAIVTLFQYVVWRGRDGNHRMIDTFLGFARTPKVGAFMTQPIATLLSEAGPDFPNRVVTLMSPYADWGQESNTNTITRWAAAALEVQYTEEIGRSVVDTLLQIASISLLKPYIPIDIWVWLKKQPSLPPVCSGRSAGTMYQVVRTVRELGDVEILKSYFLLVWSEWCSIYSGGLVEMCTSIREDLAGVGMGRHREVLVERLDRVLAQLDMGSGHLGQHNPVLNEDRILIAKGQYRELKGVLLEVDMEALEVLTQSHSTFVCALPLPYP